MSTSTNPKQLFKILVGAAWLDGKLQPEEQAYLQHIVQQKGLQDDTELQLLINGAQSISSEDCFSWVSEYLGNAPVPEHCQHLLEEISGLIYSDSEVDSKEAELLMQFHEPDPPVNPGPALYTLVTSAVQKIYRKWAKV
jgi:uncharacterized tellurite resistance protein B-like protein